MLKKGGYVIFTFNTGYKVKPAEYTMHVYAEKAKIGSLAKGSGCPYR